MKMIYRRWIGVLLLILAAAMLYGCGLAGNGSSAPRLRFPGHVRARADDTRLSLEKLTHQDVPEAAELLMQMTALEELDLGSDGLWTGEGQAEGEAASPATLRDLTPEDLLTLRRAAPEAAFLYRFRLYGKDFTTADQVMNLKNVAVTDEAAALEAVLPLMEHCRTLDMDSCGVPDAVMVRLRETWPEMDVIWRVTSGDGRSFRTDSTELDLSSLSHRDVAETALRRRGSGFRGTSELGLTTPG